MSSGMRKPPGPWGPRMTGWIGKFLTRVLWRTEVRHRGRMPRTGAVIVVPNHIGLVDAPVVNGILGRGSHTFAGEHVWKGPLRPLLAASGQIKVEGSGREALSRALGVLRRGGVIVVFPEGTRGAGSAEDTQGGAAWLAVQTGAAVIPVAIVGTRHTGEGVNVFPRPGRRILAAFGEPVAVTHPENLRGAALVRHVQDQIAAALRAHVVATAASTDLELPTDDPLREKGLR